MQIDHRWHRGYGILSSGRRADKSGKHLALSSCNESPLGPPMLASEITEALNSSSMLWIFLGIGVLLLLTLLREIPRIPARLLVLMAAAFLDMVGLLMIVPLLPFYVKRLSGGGAGIELFGTPLGTATLVGIVVATFTLAQLTSAPFWGRFSDRHGRRPALLFRNDSGTVKDICSRKISAADVLTVSIISSSLCANAPGAATSMIEVIKVICFIKL